MRNRERSSRRRVDVSTAVFMAMLTASACSPLAGQARQEVSPGTPIKRGFQTYTLFLFPSSEWLDRAQDLALLRKAYQNFGDAIGEKHLAVWFLDADNLTVSIAKSKVFCDWLELDYNSGPYVITTNVYPELMRASSKPVVIKLYDVPASKVVSILNVLEQDLRTGRDIRKTTLLFAEVKQRLLTASDLIAAILKTL